MRKVILSLLLFSLASYANATTYTVDHGLCVNATVTTNVVAKDCGFAPAPSTGASTIVTLGTITAGTWHGTAIDLATYVTGTLPAASLPVPSASTLGGVESIAAVSHQFLTSISTAGVPTLAQPACADISNAGTACTVNTGTSGATIPLLNGANTWSGVQNFGTDIKTSGTTVTATCGTTPSIRAGSSDLAGEIMTGTTTTSCIITFSATKTNAPFCVVSSQSQLTSFAFTISTTAIVVTQTSTSGNKIDWVCVQH